MSINNNLPLLALLIMSTISPIYSQTAGSLWGTTFYGGQFNYGTIYYTKPDGTDLQAVYSFGSNSGEGIKPFAELVQALNGKLYGTTTEGGIAGHGVLFEFDPTTNLYTKKVDFYASEASDVRGGLIEVNGVLYGMSRVGGAFGSGSIFKYVISTGAFSKLQNLHDYARSPMGKLVLYNNKLYGLTAAGGANNVGILFDVNPETGEIQKLIDFDGMNGATPNGSLFQYSPGVFYGMTIDGGTNNAGVIFEFNASTGVLTKKVDLDPVDGSHPFGDLVLGEDGILYGLTNKGGGNDKGVIFSYHIASNTFTKILSLSCTEGCSAYGSLTRSVTGKYYGSGSAGGSNDKGTLFEFDPTQNTYSKKSEFTGSNGDYPVYGTLTVYRSFQTISFEALANKTYGDPDFSLTATASSELPLSFVSSDSEVIEVNGSMASVVGAGSVTITANQPGNLAYFPASPVSQIQVVDKADQIITFNELDEKTYGDPSFEVTASVNTFLPITFTSSNTNAATISGNVVTIVGAGITEITAHQAGNKNYNPASILQQLTINKANQTITFNPLSDKTFGDAPFDLSATASSGLLITFTSSNTNVATIAGTKVTIVGSGTCTIKASQSGNDNYNSSEAEQNLTVIKADQIITFDALPTKTFGNAPFNLGATSTSGLTVTYTTSNSDVASVSGSLLTIVGAGEVTITASQPGNNNYNPAQSKEQLLTILKAEQTITFAALPDRAIGSSSFALNASSSSGLAVNYDFTSDKISINNNQVTLLKIGKVTITASQPGNSNYHAATSIDRSFCITPAKPSITMGNIGETITLTSSSSSGNQWFINGEAISGATGVEYLATGPGIYKVQVTLEECKSEFSNEVPLIVTGLEYLYEINLFPNPVNDYLNLIIPGSGTKHIQIVQIDGRRLESSRTEQTVFLFDVRSYASGLYIVLIEHNNKKSVLRFVKQ